MLKLIKSLNDACVVRRDIAALEEAFKVWWPLFEAPFRVIEETKPKPSNRRTRSDGEVLDEVLSIVRTIQKQSAPLPHSVSASVSTNWDTLANEFRASTPMSRFEARRIGKRLAEALVQVTHIVGSEGMTVREVAVSRNEDRPVVVIDGGLHLTAKGLEALRETLRPFSTDFDVRFALDDDPDTATGR